MNSIMCAYECNVVCILQVKIEYEIVAEVATQADGTVHDWRFQFSEKPKLRDVRYCTKEKKI